MSVEAQPLGPVEPLEPERLRIEELPFETIILGFTGPLGSGCSFLARGIARQEDYLHYKLSTPIREWATSQNVTNPSVEDLQDIGNRMRQENGKQGFLAAEGLKHAQSEWAKDANRYKGIVFDGIKNAGEIAVFRQYPNFHLFAVHAESDVRQERLHREGRIRDANEFARLDERDAEERGSYGQQVERCTYLADFICNNNTQISRQAPGAVTTYVNGSVVGKYVKLIQRMATGEPTHEAVPTSDETCMTMAYCASKRSQCMKRQVGAVVATNDGTVLATGFNDVPVGLEPCIRDPEWEGCARDKLQEQFAQNLVCCPSCGHKIALNYECAYCGSKLDQYYKRCPKCGRDPEIVYACKCGADVFKSFIPGADKKYGRLLDMCRSLHAEEIAIIGLARRGGGVPEKCVLYTTTFPCTLCARKIVAVGIERVVYAEPYPMKEAKALLEQKVQLERFEGVKSSAFFRLYR